MFGANKSIDIHKIDGTSFSFSANIKARYEPKRFQSFKEQETKENHITYRMFCNTSDIGVSDKIVHGNRTFIVGGVYEFSDGFGAHQEILMREQNTTMHDEIIIKTLKAQQSHYDDLMGEWIDDKEYNERILNVLIDSAKLMKGNFIKMLGSGKMENLEWVMTVDKPELIKKEDKIDFNGETYEIKWIIPFPDKISVGLYKHIDNYEG